MKSKHDKLLYDCLLRTLEEDIIGSCYNLFCFMSEADINVQQFNNHTKYYFEQIKKLSINIQNVNTLPEIFFFGLYTAYEVYNTFECYFNNDYFRMFFIMPDIDYYSGCDTLELILSRVANGISRLYSLVPSEYMEKYSNLLVNTDFFYGVVNDPLTLALLPEDTLSIPNGILFIHSNYNVLCVKALTNFKQICPLYYHRIEFDYLKKLNIPIHYFVLSTDNKKLFKDTSYWIGLLKPPLNNISTLSLAS